MKQINRTKLIPVLVHTPELTLNAEESEALLNALNEMDWRGRIILPQHTNIELVSWARPNPFEKKRRKAAN